MSWKKKGAKPKVPMGEETNMRLPAGASPPPDLPEKRLRRARQRFSSSPSGSARKATSNPPDGT
eukprot:8288823-Alexandrium_andersonii.AAC.1